MKHIHFDPEPDGFYGAYWLCAGANRCPICRFAIGIPTIGSALFVKWAFPAARKYPKECKETRKDIEKRMRRVLAEWVA